MSAWGNTLEHSRISYNAAAGASGAVRRNLAAASFDEQFPALEPSPPPNMASVGGRGGSPASGRAGAPLLAEQLHANETKDNAQAILNAVKQASALRGRTPRASSPSSTSQSASNILSSLSAVAGGAQEKQQWTPAQPAEILEGGEEKKKEEETSQIPTPPSDLDRFGLRGLLPLLKAEPSDQATLAIGFDLNTQGLDMASSEKLMTLFASPWLETTRSDVQPLFTTPASFTTPEDLQSVEARIPSFTDETLFFIFYSKARDALQELAARELNGRNWRFHKDLQVWLTKDSNVEPVPAGPGAERGTYVFFDPASWNYVTKDFVLSYQSII